MCVGGVLGPSACFACFLFYNLFIFCGFMCNSNMALRMGLVLEHACNDERGGIGKALVRFNK